MSAPDGFYVTVQAADLRAVLRHLVNQCDGDSVSEIALPLRRLKAILFDQEARYTITPKGRELMKGEDRG